jgi:hypothetical protein
MAATLKLQILKIKVFAALDICGGRKFTLALTPALSPRRVVSTKSVEKPERFDPAR